MTDAERAAAEILELFARAGSGVVFVSPLLFKGRSVAEVENVKERIRAIIKKFQVH